MRDAMINASAEGPQAGAREFAELAQSRTAEWQAEIVRLWLATIERSLQKNRSTFALLPMYDLVSPKGRLEMLRAKGYQIEPPIE